MPSADIQADTTGTPVGTDAMPRSRVSRGKGAKQAWRRTAFHTEAATPPMTPMPTLATSWH